MGLVPPLLRRALRIVPAVVVAWCIVLAVGSTGVPHALAVNTLVSSTPADGASLPSSPTSMLFTFSEPLGPTNKVVVTCNGQGFPVGNPTLNADGLGITVAVPNPMPAGTCTAVWMVSASDSTPNGQGSIAFTVTGDAPAGVTPSTGPVVTGSTVAGGATVPTTVPPATDAGSDEAATAPKVGGPLGVFRFFAAALLAILLGSVVLIVMAWPEGVEYILTVRFLRIVWVLGLVCAIGTAICLRAQITGESIGSSIVPTAWSDLTDTGPGIAALARVVLAAACGWVVVRPERVLDQQTQLPALVIPVATVATFGFSRPSGDLAVLGVAAGVTHVIAMAIWFGGIALLSRVVLAGPGDDDLVHAVRGFSRISTPALLITIVSGALLGYRLDRHSLLGTGHGRVLVLKTLVTIAMVMVGLATRQFVRARLRKVDAMTVPLAARLRRATSIEAAGGIVVLALSSWMLALNPGGLVHEPSVHYGNEARIVVDDLDVTVRVTGTVGANGVRVEVAQPPSGLSSLQVTFIPPDPTTVAQVVLTLPPELAGAGVAVLPQTEGVPLGIAGVWTVKVDGVTATGPKSAQKTFTLNE